MNQQKIIYTKNIAVYITTIIYILLLHFYNHRLYQIQSRYSEKLYAAIKVMEDPDFIIYFGLGLFFIMLLIYSSIKRVRELEIIGLKNVVILVILKIIVLIILLIVYFIPILTSIPFVLDFGFVFLNVV